MSERTIPGMSFSENAIGLSGTPNPGSVGVIIVGTACKGPTTPQFFGSAEKEKFLSALSEVGGELANFYEKKLALQIETTQKEIAEREKNVESLQSELENEIAIQQLRQESGEAYDLQKIENLQKNIEAEEQLKAEAEAKSVAQQKRMVLFQLAINTTESIGSLIAASEGNPLNLLTGGLAGITQFAVGLARIFANFALAKSQLAGFKDGVINLQGEGTETSDSILARLSKGESVMTAKETRQNLGTLNMIRDGVNVDNLIFSEKKELDLQRNKYLAKIAQKEKKVVNLNYKTLSRNGRI